MTSDTKNDSAGSPEIVMLPRETWERVNGALKTLEAFLENAELLSNIPRHYRDEAEENGRSLEEWDRMAIIRALEGVLLVFDELFPGRGVLKWPLVRIYDALGGVHFGLAPDPVLQGKHKNSRPPHGVAMQRLKGEAAAALELYRRSGQDLQLAADVVARKLQVRDLTAIGYNVSPHQEIKGALAKGLPKGSLRGVAP